MRINKGFTLIELLAVIVILAIIALIAVPIILSVISDAKKSTITRGGELYLNEIKTEITRQNLNESLNPSECEVQATGDVVCDGDTTVKVEMNGSKPSCGTITIDKGEITNVRGLIIDGQKLEYDTNKKLVIVSSNATCEVTYTDNSGAIAPVLGELTPVVYDGTKWVVADTSKKWYDYLNQEWANAVILKSGVTKSTGDTVNIESGGDIQGIFVWIPRYEYKIEGQYGTHYGTGENGANVTGTSKLPGEILVNFISKTATASEGYRIHPAFTYDGQPVSGIWVAKFETSGTATAPTILPNVQSLTNQNVSTQFTTAQKFNDYFTTSPDVHMTKNSEWGAVAYLSQSKYGKYGNSNYEGREKEIYINNSSNYYTGRSGGSYAPNTAIKNTYTDQTSTTTYNSYGFYTYDGYLLSYGTNTKTETRDINKGAGASTTGNITGVYDMSGGALEYVMGVYRGTNASTTWGASTQYGNHAGFTTTPSSKYFDEYTTNIETTACNSGICYGHALSETSRWYSDYDDMAISTVPWFVRGGYSSRDNSSAGVFYFGSNTGDSYSYDSFRICLAMV